MGILVKIAPLTNSAMTAPPKKMWMHHYMQGEEPKECKSSGDSSTAALAIADQQKQQRVVTSPSPIAACKTSIGANGGFYADERSSSPPRGVRDYYSHSQQPWETATLYGNGGASSRGYVSDGGLQSYRIDELPSRTHRLEEALLRATRKTSPAPSSASGGGGYAGHNGPRSSPDDLLELRKRGGAGTREVHNKLEKNRRAHLRECFEFLRKQLPAVDDKKLSNLGILKNALRYIQSLKRKEREFEHTMERLAREKISLQQRLASLKKEVATIPGHSADSGALDLGSVLPVLHNQNLAGVETSAPLTYANLQAHTAKYAKSALQQQHDAERDSCSTSTASEQGENESEDRMVRQQHEQQQIYGQKRSYTDNHDHQPGSKSQQSKYMRTGINGSNGSTSSIPPTYVTVESGASETPLFLRQPVTLANGISSHVQLGAGMQLIGSPLKVALQPLVTVHPQGTKTISEEIAAASLLNVTTASGAAAGICIPAGVVIPGLVTLSPEAGDSRLTQVHSSQPVRGTHGGAPPSAVNTSSPSPLAAVSSTTDTVMSLSNGIIKTSATRTLPIQPPSSTTGGGHVVTPIGRSLPIVTSVAVMPPSKHVTHILANTSLDKVVTGPLIKTGPIPIFSGQYLTSSQLTAGRHVIKPLVVVAATPPPAPPPPGPPQRGDTPPS